MALIPQSSPFLEQLRIAVFMPSICGLCAIRKAFTDCIENSAKTLSKQIPTNSRKPMTSAAPGPQVNYFTGQEGNGESAETREKPYQQEQRPLTDGVEAGPSGGLAEAHQQRTQHICIVCGDESDGAHFGIGFYWQ